MEPRELDPEETKSCCAAAYGRDAVALLLGESYHPGGLSLTRRLADRLDLCEGGHVLDVASGPGATARLLAVEHGVRVDGVDLGERTLATARTETERAGLSDRVCFHQGDAERMPVADNAYDALVCECAFCTFPDKAAAAAEFARVLRPGGRVGITDVTVAESGLPEELSGLAGWVACVADARPVTDYAALLAEAGLLTVATERHDGALARMIDQIEARVRLLSMTAPERLAQAGVDADALAPYLEAARRAVADGRIGYALIVARKPDA
ncbi:class I SAM-dependent methyltransferase [Nocardiopsis sp. NRRL B-16309]|uniref:class I SAM-dependent methyltransferase n=1 Tax=Nocardiopsis sp. NRRL B-16309 TaxID=1519494 RepID=UPI000A4BEF65|nr:methyltransferase domain-containing protein [Nocardiopsis sp. NRRL B-16309]